MFWITLCFESLSALSHFMLWVTLHFESLNVLSYNMLWVILCCESLSFPVLSHQLTGNRRIILDHLWPDLTLWRYMSADTVAVHVVWHCGGTCHLTPPCVLLEWLSPLKMEIIIIEIILLILLHHLGILRHWWINQNIMSITIPLCAIKIPPTSNIIS